MAALKDDARVEVGTNGPPAQSRIDHVPMLVEQAIFFIAHLTL